MLKAGVKDYTRKSTKTQNPAGLLEGEGAGMAVDFTINPSSLTYVGGTGVQAIDATATVQGGDFANATLRVAIDPSDVEVTEDILQVLTRSPTLIANGGSISVNSERGRGTSVTLTLPLA